MKILQICHKPPCPPVDGGCLASYQLSKGILEQQVQLHVFSMETVKHPVIENDEFFAFKKETAFQSVFIDTSIHFLDAFFTWIRGRSYHVQRFASKKVEKKLKSILLNNTYDVVILESLFATPYLSLVRKYTCAKVILRQHNIEYTIWNRLAAHNTMFLKRLGIKLLIPSLKNYELKMMKKVDATYFISDIDRSFAQSNSHIPNAKLLPFGINLKKYPCKSHLTVNNFFHLGSMSWLPNREGIDYFLSDIFPQFVKKHPESTFVLAGRETTEYYESEQYEGFACVGEVADAKQFIADNGVMVVPLLSGSGVRIKIIEAMAMGKAVITTPVGAEGLAVTDGENILIANTDEEWMACLEKCYLDKAYCEAIGQNARKYIEMHHDNASIIAAFVENL